MKAVRRIKKHGTTSKPDPLRIQAVRRDLEQKRKDLRDAIETLANARDAAYALQHRDDSTSYFDPQALGTFAHLAINDAGETIERVLIEFDLLSDRNPRFVNRPTAEEPNHA